MTGREVTEIADRVFWLPIGAGLLPANVYFVGAQDSWVLIDSGWPGGAAAIRSGAQSLFGHAARQRLCSSRICTPTTPGRPANWLNRGG